MLSEAGPGKGLSPPPLTATGQVRKLDLEQACGEDADADGLWRPWSSKDPAALNQCPFSDSVRVCVEQPAREGKGSVTGT